MLVDRTKFLVGIEMDDQLAAATAARERDFGAECAAESLFQPARVGDIGVVGRTGLIGDGLRSIGDGLQASREFLGLADSELARHHLLGCPDQRIVIVQGEERTRMAFA